MRKFAPVAMLMALLTSLLLIGATTAQAGPTNNLDFDCNQVVGVNVACNTDVFINSVNVGNITVTIDHSEIRALTENETTVLEDNLNDADVDVANLTVEDNDVFKNVVIATYESFDPKIIISDNDITVCILALACS